MAENLNTGGSLRQIILPYPQFRLGEIIDPGEHNANNAETINKINEMVTVLNSFINGEANTSLSAMAIAVPGIDPIEGTDLETFLRTLIGLIISTAPDTSGAHFVGSAKIEGVPGENIWEQLAYIAQLSTGLDAKTGEELSADTTLVGRLEKLLHDFTIHVSGTDHDLRYYTKEEMDAKLLELRNIKLDKTGDFEGTWKGRSLEMVLNASGTEFGLIEVREFDPINPKIGQVWILVPPEENDGGVG